MNDRPFSNRSRNSTFTFGSRPPWSENRTNDTRPDMQPVDGTPEGMFYLLSTLCVPSMIGFVFVLYNFVRLPQLWRRSTNRLIICLLIINFVHVRFVFSFQLSIDVCHA